MTFHIAQISDTHLSAEKPFFAANFDRVGEALRDARPDLVLNSGDISLNGVESDDDLAVARHHHDALDLPVRCIPGNHDVGDNQEVRHAGYDHPIDAPRRARYRRHFGADWWLLDVPGWRLIAVNAQLLGADLEAAAEQEEFITDAAAGARGRRIALFIHKPLFDQSADETAVGGRFLNPGPRGRLLAAFGKMRPTLVASGHVHQYRTSEVSGVRHVWAPSTGFIIPDRRQPRYGLKEVGYVAHALHEDGAHDCRFVAVPGASTLDIADFPAAYGPLD
ncbi:MAG TPA: metallophosphoesterase [Vineibacter sp.]|nr:metallophosphoesterase [Vineibacter sp.]